MASAALATALFLVRYIHSRFFFCLGFDKCHLLRVARLFCGMFASLRAYTKPGSTSLPTHLLFRSAAPQDFAREDMVNRQELLTRQAAVLK